MCYLEIYTYVVKATLKKPGRGGGVDRHHQDRGHLQRGGRGWRQTGAHRRIVKIGNGLFRKLGVGF